MTSRTPDISVRQPEPPPKPGLHSYNFDRRVRPRKDRHRTVKIIQALLVVCGLAGLGFYGYSLADQYIYQAYGNWSFEQQIAGRRVNFANWLRERTPLGGFMTPAETAKEASAPIPATDPSAERARVIPRPVTGALLGRIEIDRLNISQVVREGVDDDVLKRAVGHVPSTALPGQIGNFAIAAHRDTLFRGLKDIKKDDQVKFQSAQGTYTYQVVSTEIVRPTDVSVLRPRGSDKLLTMITCYPFYFVGSAPKRFIVQARLVSQEAGVQEGIPPQAPVATASGESPPKVLKPIPSKSKVIQQSGVREPRVFRGSSRYAARQNVGRPADRVLSDSVEYPRKLEKKRGFWRRLFHRNDS